MSNRQINDHARILMDAKKLIEDPEDWTPHVDPPKSCLVTAVSKTVGTSGWLLHYYMHPLNKAAWDLGYPIGPVQANFEGHAVAMQVMDLAIQYAMEGQDE